MARLWLSVVVGYSGWEDWCGLWVCGRFVVRRCGYGCLWWWDMAVGGDWCGLWVCGRLVVSGRGGLS
ncbi:hypothetical protein [Bartonella elizabethae]|uniref:hypothetical protein n=1 Tax=Bartonella elizabethae TaxID=807 RepID=UPI000F834997|nr:hypothetical protein [Bartonella elizabethae]